VRVPVASEILPNTMTKSPASFMATAGNRSESPGEPGNANSPPWGSPLALKRRANMPWFSGRVEVPVQTTTKLPAGSMATAGLTWLPTVELATRNSGPRFAPAAS
jgi:hypothetical protein